MLYIYLTIRKYTKFIVTFSKPPRRSETVALLNDIPNKSLPLIKFRELYEKRYHRPIAVSELYKMREAVTIQGDSGSRIVYLNTEYCDTPSLPDSEDSQDCSAMERPYCEVHFQVSASDGWAEQYNICPLPLVHISLKTLSTAVHRLLDSHQGSLPLISFCDCYEAEIGPLPIVGNFVSNKEESLEVSSGANQISKEHKGVPLEHLIACIAGIEVAKSVFCIKKVQWLENKIDNQATQNFIPALLGQLTLFGREVMDLLKSQPQCLVLFNKFIPTYHHHFGRQCRVADYGFTKLIDLLEAIPHIVQVMGEGQNRQVTLTHRTQVKRFAAELLRILKSRASKQIALSEFSQAYEQVIEKPFEITNYGVCEIEDLLDEVPENVIVTSGSGSETIISIPKREQTPEEIECTKLFAEEVVELMKHTPNCSMAFNKFIPSYHHHFAKQCRVADYGFTKLIELFEAIPSVLEVNGTGDDKILKLVESEQHKILSERLVTVIKAQPTEMVDITQLCSAYTQVHGHTLRPSDFGFLSLEALLEKLNSTFKVIFRARRSYVCLVDHELTHQISLNIRRLLMEQSDGTMPIKDVCNIYQTRFGPNTDLVFYFRDLSDVIKITGGFLQLTPLQLLARDMILLLQENSDQLSLSVLGSMFQQKFGVPICTVNYGFQNLYSMLEHLSDYFLVKGKRQKRIVYLSPDIIGSPLFSKAIHPATSLKMKQSSIDILNEPVPSCVPSPNIEPHVKERLEDLMGFETPPVEDVFCVAQPSFEYKSPKENIITSVSNVIRTSISPARAMSVGTAVSPSCQKCSSVTTLTYSVPCLEMSTKSSVHLPQISTVNPRAATEFHQNVERPIFSVIDVSKTYVLEPEEKQAVNLVKQNTENLHEKYNDCKHLENFVSNVGVGKISVISQSFEDVAKYNRDSLGTKDDIPSSESTPTSESRQQSRRNRIAAQFSSPIDG